MRCAGPTTCISRRSLWPWFGRDWRSMVARFRSLPPRTSRTSRWAGYGFSPITVGSGAALRDFLHPSSHGQSLQRLHSLTLVGNFLSYFSIDALEFKSRVMSMEASWIPRELNVDAGQLSNMDGSGFDPMKRIPVESSDLKWHILEDARRWGEKLQRAREAWITFFRSSFRSVVASNIVSRDVFKIVSWDFLDGTRSIAMQAN